MKRPALAGSALKADFCGEPRDPQHDADDREPAERLALRRAQRDPGRRRGDAHPGALHDPDAEEPQRAALDVVEAVVGAGAVDADEEEAGETHGPRGDHDREDPRAGVGCRGEREDAEGDDEEGSAAGQVEEPLRAPQRRRDEDDHLDGEGGDDGEGEQGDAGDGDPSLAPREGDEPAEDEGDEDREERGARRGGHAGLPVRVAGAGDVCGGVRRVGAGLSGRGRRRARSPARGARGA
jgi:hypothetical protein